MSAPQQSSKLFQLPRELRDTIYRLLLCYDSEIPIQVRGGVRQRVGWTRAERPSISVFYVCKLLHDEATSVFYSENHLSMQELFVELVHEFFSTIGSINTASITRLSMYVCRRQLRDFAHGFLESEHFDPLGPVCSSLPNLRELKLRWDAVPDELRYVCFGADLIAAMLQRSMRRLPSRDYCVRHGVGWDESRYTRMIAGGKDLAVVPLVDYTIDRSNLWQTSREPRQEIEAAIAENPQAVVEAFLQ